MSFTINPALRDYPEEVGILGSMLLGYGELEFLFAMSAGLASGDASFALHAASHVRSETARLDIIDSIASRIFTKLKLIEDYDQTHEAIRHCLKIRNQWAHSHWGHNENGLVFQMFSNSEIFNKIQPLDNWSTIDLKTLKSQASYFEYCRECGLILERNAVQAHLQKQNRDPMPSKRHKPHMRSQPSKRSPRRP